MARYVADDIELVIGYQTEPAGDWYPICKPVPSEEELCDAYLATFGLQYMLWGMLVYKFKTSGNRIWCRALWERIEALSYKAGKGFAAREANKAAANFAGKVTKDLKQWGYKNDHHLLEERVPPLPILELQQLLQRPENKDIYDAGNKGTSFEDCIGHIAAVLDIVLDGYYGAPDLCNVLCKAIRLRRAVGNNPNSVDPSLISVEIIERAETLELVEADMTLAPLSKQQLETKERSSFMQEHNCRQCDQIKLCIANGKCLGDVQIEDAAKRLEDLSE